MFNKVVHPCDIPQGEAGRLYPVFCKIEVNKDG